MTKKKKNWTRRILIQKILAKLHIASIAGFLVSLTIGATIALLITGAAWFYVAWRNERLAKEDPPIIYQYNP